MKVVLFNGSARKNGVTNSGLNIVMNELEAEGIDVELFWIGFDIFQDVMLVVNV